MYEMCEKNKYIKIQDLLNRTKNLKIQLKVKIFQRYAALKDFCLKFSEHLFCILPTGSCF